MPHKSSSALCKSCQSKNRKVFSGEVAIHYSGLEGVNKPIVWVFPKLVVCAQCGFAEFLIPKHELEMLSNDRSQVA